MRGFQFFNVIRYKEFPFLLGRGVDTIRKLLLRLFPSIAEQLRKYLN